VVSSEFLGPFRNGGIGTAYTRLAELLRDAGHDVTLLYTNGRFTIAEPIEYWETEYRNRGLRLVPLPESPVPLFSISPNLSVSYRVYLWLRDHDRFDVVHFPEYLGHGYHSLTAQRQGLILQRAVTIVGLHSSTHWLRVANDRLAHCEAELEDDFLEQSSAELADLVWSPSRYMLQWARDRGWDLTEPAHVQPYVMPEGEPPDPQPLPARPVSEVVFFGRQEVRKGLFLFLAAIDGLAQSQASFQGQNLVVTILGKPLLIDGRDSQQIIAERARGWPFEVRILPDRDPDQARDYLRGQGRLAVMPSLIENYPNTVLECLAHKIPFLASRVGGIPEQIAAADLHRVCFEPTPAVLAQRLEEAVRCGHAPAQLAFDPAQNSRDWVRWHEQLPSLVDRRHAAAGPGAEPTISVCIAHYNRPAYLRQALRSIAEQDRAPLEVIVVDDGSPGQENGDELDAIEREFDFAERGWRLVRQENRYLGAARNRAAAEARGEFLLFMDDDNVAKPQEIATFATVARHSGADVITCLMDMFEGPSAPWFHDRPKLRCLFPGAVPGLSVLQNTFGDANALYRREAFFEVGGFTEDYGVTHEDWELFARLMTRGYRLTTIPIALFWYRKSLGSMIRSTPLRANYERSLRPHLDLVPRPYHRLFEMAIGQSLVSRSPVVQETVETPLRYRVVDTLNTRLQRLPLVHKALKKSARLVLQAGRSLVRFGRLRGQKGHGRGEKTRANFGPNLIKHEGVSRPRPMFLRMIAGAKGERV